MTEDQEKYQSDIVKFDSRHSKLPAPEQDNSFFATIERLSARPDIPVEKIKQIMEMQEHILDRNAKQAFNAAMTQAQSKIKAVVARSDNDQTKSKYANLKTVLVEAAPIYTAEGFSLMFYPLESQKESHQRVGVDIMHEQGHTEQRYGDFAIQTTGIGGKSMMTQIHGEGSAFSYGRRYLTCMIFNIPTGDDDDGNTAGGSVELGKLEQWMAECNEACEAAKSADEVANWWTMNGAAVKKDLPKAQAAKIWESIKAHKKRFDQQGREPGSDDK